MIHFSFLFLLVLKSPSIYKMMVMADDILNGTYVTYCRSW